MSKINLLESKVYNRISAGEVVERPASVIKEVIENSLDAGATSISVEIEGGGIKLIKVIDNGAGIEFDDLQKAFLPHATSKITCEDDLDSISTLGFRGEALASIGAVSQTQLISKTSSSETGGCISISGGVMNKPEICACNNGTTICVKNLFYNTPARLKFLKSERQEEGAITNIMDRLILSHPEIAFKYIVDGKTIYNSPLKGLKEKIYNIYGKGIYENLIECSNANNRYKLSGYISSPTQCKANRTYQTLIVNGRYISNSLISVAISNAYENFLMKGKFPLFVLNLELPYEDIDVNVHPSKMEVRFKDTKAIYDFFYSTILQTLQNNNFPVEVDNLVQNLPSFMPNIEKKMPEKIQEVKSGFSFGDMQNLTNEINKINISTSSTEVSSNNILKENNIYSSLISKDNNSKFDINSTAFDNRKDNTIDENNFVQNEIVYKQESLTQDIPYRVIGNLFNTYVLIESGDALYMIDQHAGHERVLFDKFIQMYNDKKMISQPLLIPYLFEVNEIEKALVQDNFDVIAQMGFSIEEFGNNSYRIVAIPSILSGIDLQEFVTESLSDTNKISSTNEQIKNHFATCACKAAVKGGQNLSDNEIQALLGEVMKSGRRLQCPHGRPVCIKLAKYEIEKLFKRIVS